MHPIISFCGLLFFACLASGGHHGIVDDEIWSHVFKVLSDTEHGKKVIVSHPEPAYLVDAYTKSFHHEPFAHYDLPHHHGHVYHAPHHLHAHPIPLHHGHHEPHHHHHHPHVPHHHPAPVYRVPFPVPALIDTYGPPHFHRHHKK